MVFNFEQYIYFKNNLFQQQDTLHRVLFYKVLKTGSGSALKKSAMDADPDTDPACFLTAANEWGSPALDHKSVECVPYTLSIHVHTVHCTGVYCTSVHVMRSWDGHG